MEIEIILGEAMRQAQTACDRALIKRASPEHLLELARNLETATERYLDYVRRMQIELMLGEAVRQAQNAFDRAAIEHASSETRRELAHNLETATTKYLDYVMRDICPPEFK